jgi:hypothetical protein
LNVAKYEANSVIITGATGTATWTGPMPTIDKKTGLEAWETITVPLTQSAPGWTVSKGTTLNAILNDVTKLEIQIELVNNNPEGAKNSDIEGMDHIELVSTAVPEPTGVALAGVSLFGVGANVWRRWRKRRLALA